MEALSYLPNAILCHIPSISLQSSRNPSSSICLHIHVSKLAIRSSVGADIYEDRSAAIWSAEFFSWWASRWFPAGILFASALSACKLLLVDGQDETNAVCRHLGWLYDPVRDDICDPDSGWGICLSLLTLGRAGGSSRSRGMVILSHDVAGRVCVCNLIWCDCVFWNGLVGIWELLVASAALTQS